VNRLNLEGQRPLPVVTFTNSPNAGLFFGDRLSELGGLMNMIGAIASSRQEPILIQGKSWRYIGIGANVLRILRGASASGC
jgi:hypothetical protein